MKPRRTLRRLASHREIDPRAVRNRVTNAPPEPTSHYTTTAGGRTMRMWSDGSWRRHDAPLPDVVFKRSL